MPRVRIRLVEQADDNGLFNKKKSRSLTYHHWLKKYSSRVRRRQGGRYLDKVPSKQYYRGWAL